MPCRASSSAGVAVLASLAFHPWRSGRPSPLCVGARLLCWVVQQSRRGMQGAQDARREPRPEKRGLTRTLYHTLICTLTRTLPLPPPSPQAAAASTPAH